MADTPQTPDSNLIDQAELDGLEQQMREAQGAAPPKAAWKPPVTAAPAPEQPAAPAPAVAQDTAASADEAPEAPPEPQAEIPPDDAPTAGSGPSATAAPEPAPAENDAPAVVGSPVAGPAVEAAPLELSEFDEPADAAVLANIDLLDDVELDVKIELGRTQMYIEDVLRLGEGSVVELDKLAGDPVDVYVNERLVARGEVLVLNDNFCVRINDIISVNPELEESKK